jgi:hypothetical protein
MNTENKKTKKVKVKAVATENQSGLKYRDLIQQSAKDRESAEVESTVEEAELQLKSDILATKKLLVAARKTLAAAKSVFPLNANRIVSLQLDVEGYEDGLARIEALHAELF